jgi:Zn-dependent protease
MGFLQTDFNMLQVVIWVAVLFISIAFHEYSHGWMASVLGDDTAERQGRLTLNPIAHIDPFGSVILPLMLFLFQAPFLFAWAKPVPFNPANLRDPRWGSAAVAAAGPASNLLIAIFGALVFRFFLPGTETGAFTDAHQFFAFLAITNIALAIFNLLPIPPLDGSKLLAAVLPEAGREIFDFLERIGPIFVFLVLIFMFRFIAPVLFTVILSIFRFLAGV